VTPRPGQPERAAARMRAYAEQGVHPGSLPNSGVLARHNSIATPALLPDGTVSEASVSQTLAVRGVIVDAPALAEVTADTFRAAADVAEEDEQ
jgi:NADH-quinone oxidoreductase subunit J